MATISAKDEMVNGKDIFPLNDSNDETQVMHQIGAIRRQQGISLRAAARQLGKTVEAVGAEEDEASDLRLSEVYAWQNILDVPVSDLLIDSETPLSRPVMERARLVRLMKTAAAICEESDSESVGRLGERLVEQLIEIMPELKEVGAWHAVGKRRSLSEYGRVFDQRISEEMLLHYQNGYQD